MTLGHEPSETAASASASASAAATTTSLPTTTTTGTATTTNRETAPHSCIVRQRWRQLAKSLGKQQCVCSQQGGSELCAKCTCGPFVGCMSQRCRRSMAHPHCHGGAGCSLLSDSRRCVRFSVDVECDKLRSCFDTCKGKYSVICSQAGSRAQGFSKRKSVQSEGGRI